MKCLPSIFCVLVSMLISVNSSADSDACKSSYEAKIYGKALNRCRASSINGDAIGKFYLGMMYLKGEGVAVNESLAARLIQEAAQLGETDALAKMGKMYQSGELGKKDHVKSCDWWEQLADMGNALGQEQTGVCYLMGRGRDKNMKLGYAYLSLASKNGSTAAKYIIDTYGERFSAEAKQEALQLADQISQK